MKNWIKGLAAGILVLGLAACTTTAQPKTDSATGKKVEVKNESKMTAQEVYKKSMEVSKDQKSMHAKMDIKQKIEVPSQKLNIDSKIKMDMDMVMEPLAMYQNMKMDMGEQGAVDMEMYMTEEGFFMFNPELNQWLQMPAEMSKEMIDGMGGGADPTLDMEMFKEFSEDFKFEQTDDAYILTLSASGDKFSSLFKKMAADSMPAGMELGEEEAGMMEDIDVKSLEFEIYMDKKTYFTTSFTMDMDMTMKVEGEEMHIIQKMKADISKINEIDKIVIPQEVLDNVMNIEDMMNK